MATKGLEHPSMDWGSSNLAEAWKRFKVHCQLMFGGPLKSKSEEEHTNYLLIWIGEKGRDIYNSMTFTSGGD